MIEGGSKDVLYLTTAQLGDPDPLPAMSLTKDSPLFFAWWLLRNSHQAKKRAFSINLITLVDESNISFNHY